MSKVLILDTSILCVWLNVPGMETCGSDADRWDRDRVDQKISEEMVAKTTFVLPMATLIETGNHIAQAAHSRWERANALAEIIRKSAQDLEPWAAFSHQSDLWSPEGLEKLADSWPSLANQCISIGDATIKDVAEFYAQSRFAVEILTGDEGLKSYEPVTATETPRRRKR
ncbi:hypothetical protein [Leucothrix pacifica]|uniref:PIN domain-containing protein n=1 Tax=Leucothrix pacifica TaxID=1247513 RepID=A0A317CFG7_9GAMM|nr:hypothetical protein [Leucothrix pacifica]PWQ97089.1 hypothetical protein DKW60_11040 [Leucothrix pacifica]